VLRRACSWGAAGAWRASSHRLDLDRRPPSQLSLSFASPRRSACRRWLCVRPWLVIAVVGACECAGSCVRGSAEPAGDANKPRSEVSPPSPSGIQDSGHGHHHLSSSKQRSGGTSAAQICMTRCSVGPHTLTLWCGSWPEPPPPVKQIQLNFLTRAQQQHLRLARPQSISPATSANHGVAHSGGSGKDSRGRSGRTPTVPLPLQSSLPVSQLQHARTLSPPVVSE
jgi:hypothetical protein